MSADRVERFFRRLREEIGSVDEFTVEVRHNEALGQVRIGEDFYVFITVPWSDDEYYIEFMVGDENAVIQPRHMELLDRAVEIVKRAYALSREELGI